MYTPVNPRSNNILKVGWGLNYHYANMPMQYTAVFHGCKNYIFQIKNCDIFLFFAQNIDHGHTLEPAH